MRKNFIGFFGTFFTIYGIANYYIALRFWQSLFSTFALSPSWYWTVYVLMASTPVLSRLAVCYSKEQVSVKLSLLSAYWLGVSFYAFFLWLLADIIKAVGKWLGVSVGQPQGYWGGALFILLVGLLVWGSYNARRPIVRNYKLTIDKPAGKLHKLRAVLVSDIHLGPIIGRRRLEQMVAMINRINPDIIFFAGDTIDEDVLFFAERQMPAVLRKLKPPLGSYAVLGNHEYLGGHADLAAHYLEKAGLTVLRDRVLKVNDCLYIAGRDDPTLKQMTGMPRQPLAKILNGKDAAMPLILIDHQPYDLNAAKDLEVDLLLAGHTHRGQFFPNNLITSHVFELDWGYLMKDGLQVIVSCGFGTWGPPIRIGNSPELVDIEINFNPKAGKYNN